MVRAMAAPIAHFDDDRPNLADLTAGSVLHFGRTEVSPAAAAAAAGDAAARFLLDQDHPPGRADSDGSPEESSGRRSTEERVNGAEEKLRVKDGQPERIGPGSAFAEETLLEKDESGRTMMMRLSCPTRTS